ncbi:MAG: leucyl aminopeptidase family protein [Bacteroidales bacterium]
MITLHKSLLREDFNTTTLFVVRSLQSLPEGWLSQEELEYVHRISQDQEQIQAILPRGTYSWVITLPKTDEDESVRAEFQRRAGAASRKIFVKEKTRAIKIVSFDLPAKDLYHFTEGFVLDNYTFSKYITDPAKIPHTIQEIQLHSEDLGEADVDRLRILSEAVFFCRDLVNEPASALNAEVLAQVLFEEASKVGVKAEVFNIKKIEALKMGGLLSVNKGSSIPPTFTVLEWKPQQPVNDKPLVLIGKGVTFDTGGMNLKTGTFMDGMKMDMAGAATVSAALLSIARMGLPLHVIALIPATDNRINSDAMVPGDVITIHNGKTVEVLNTDAEGRLILADALSYAARLDPVLVITVATLTGAAARAVGPFGMVMMQVKAATWTEKLKKSGQATYERMVEFPMWDEYAGLLKSNIADIKNVGPAEAGAITAAKFLEFFTSYPFIHLDIAGTSFAEKPEHYITQGATGTGVRLLVHFAESLIDLA